MNYKKSIKSVTLYHLGLLNDSSRRKNGDERTQMPSEGEDK